MLPEIEYIEAKSILSKLIQNDTFFGLGYSMNLYRGCQHACIYCDTRSECYGVGDIARIRVKRNAIELLRKELSGKRRKKVTIGTGSMNDPYMPVEKEMKVTQKAMQTIADYRFPVHVITKSDLVVRDTDILQDISKTYAAVSFTITTANDALSEKIEPLAPVSSKRFAAIESLAKRGIYTGITLMPLLPFVNDTKENLETILKMAKDAGASYIMPMFGMTLRKGSRDYFYQELDNSFGGLKERYVSTFGDQYVCNSPRAIELERLFKELCRSLNLESWMKFYEPNDENKQLSLF